MDEQKAREILGDVVQPDNSLHSSFQGPDHYISWNGKSSITLAWKFNIEELEAIAWWMKNMKVR